jgi:cytidylate kinase
LLTGDLMMAEPTRREPRMSAAAEREMRAWVLQQEAAEDAPPHDQPASQREPADQAVPELGHLITVSRECGAAGSHVAELVGRQLGWKVLDKNLLDQVAEASHVPRSTLEGVDETTPHWADGLLAAWFDARSVPHHKYVVHLGRVVLTAAREGNVVFVGRGAQFFLPPGRGLAVRIVAPEDYRVEQIMRRYCLGPRKARQLIADVDRGRREFVQRFFHRRIDDPHVYDLVINVGRLGPVAAAEKIVAAYLR